MPKEVLKTLIDDNLGLKDRARLQCVCKKTFEQCKFSEILVDPEEKKLVNRQFDALERIISRILHTFRHEKAVLIGHRREWYATVREIVMDTLKDFADLELRHISYFDPPEGNEYAYDDPNSYTSDMDSIENYDDIVRSYFSTTVKLGNYELNVVTDGDTRDGDDHMAIPSYALKHDDVYIFGSSNINETEDPSSKPDNGFGLEVLWRIDADMTVEHLLGKLEPLALLLELVKDRGLRDDVFAQDITKHYICTCIRGVN